MTPIILALIQQGIIPEVVAYIRQRFTATGQMPTDQEVIDHLIVQADAIVAIGEAWLNAHPPPDPTVP